MSLEALKEIIQKKCYVSFDYNKAGKVLARGNVATPWPEAD
jgi:hypothetical protein